MAVQYKNGSWGGIKNFDAAVDEFNTAAAADLARKLVVGTEEEVKKMVEEAAVEERLDDLQARLKTLEADKDSSIEIPTAEDVARFGNG